MFRDDEIKSYENDIKKMESDQKYYSKFLYNLCIYNMSIENVLQKLNKDHSQCKWSFLLNMGAGALCCFTGLWILGVINIGFGVLHATRMMKNAKKVDEFEKTLQHNQRVEVEVKKYVRFLNSKIKFDKTKVAMIKQTEGKSFEEYWTVHNTVGPAKYKPKQNELSRLEDFHEKCIKKLNREMGNLNLNVEREEDFPFEL